MTDEVSVTREIAAPADTVWAMIAELSRMGEWSPENAGGTWIRGATGPVPGAKFRGSNRHGNKEWKSVATVVEAAPGRRFSFRVNATGIPISKWRYDFEPTESGCKVTESWSDRRPAFFKPIAARATGVADRAARNRSTMERTLEKLARVAEADTR
jgi:uncharacterized protein YndB with AHSA1/START domain